MIFTEPLTDLMIYAIISDIRGNHTMFIMTTSASSRAAWSSRHVLTSNRKGPAVGGLAKGPAAGF